jgi:Fe-S-cluster formation regulator IscX/YfhJ
MNENRRQVLDMLSEGKITVDEAERLLFLVDKESSGSQRHEPETRNPSVTPKYIRIVVQPESEGDSDDSPNLVNIRVPMSMLRAGMQLAALIPEMAASGINQALHENGIDIDVSRLKAQDIERLLEALQDFEVDVHTGDQRVLIYVE